MMYTGHAGAINGSRPVITTHDPKLQDGLGSAPSATKYDYEKICGIHGCKTCNMLPYTRLYDGCRRSKGRCPDPKLVADCANRDWRNDSTFEDKCCTKCP